MNRRQVILLVFIVALLHGAVLWGLLSVRKPAPRRMEPPARPNFFARESKWLDESSGEIIVYREFQVSSRLTETEEKPRPVETERPLTPPITHTP